MNEEGPIPLLIQRIRQQTLVSRPGPRSPGVGCAARTGGAPWTSPCSSGQSALRPSPIRCGQAFPSFAPAQANCSGAASPAFGRRRQTSNPAHRVGGRPPTSWRSVVTWARRPSPPTAPSYPKARPNRSQTPPSHCPRTAGRAGCQTSDYTCARGRPMLHSPGCRPSSTTIRHGHCSSRSCGGPVPPLRTCRSPHAPRRSPRTSRACAPPSVATSSTRCRRSPLTGRARSS